MLLYIQLKGNHRYAHAASDETLEFYYKKSKEVLQSTSLCSKPSGNLDVITINVTKIVSWSDASGVGGRKMVCVYVSGKMIVNLGSFNTPAFFICILFVLVYSRVSVCVCVYVYVYVRVCLSVCLSSVCLSLCLPKNLNISSTLIFC